MPATRRAVIFISVLVLSVALDQGSKAWARTLPVHPASCAVPADLIAHRCGGVPQPVISGYWDWELAMNDGAAFSSLEGGLPPLVFIAIAGIALVVIGVAAARTTPDERRKRLAYALIAGGALGNLIDRVYLGAVTDFVRWHVHAHMWPIFNVADAALLVGAGLLFLDRAVSHRTKSRDREATA